MIVWKYYVLFQSLLGQNLNQQNYVVLKLDIFKFIMLQIKK